MDRKQSWKQQHSTEVEFVPRADAKLKMLSDALDGKETILDMIKRKKITHEEILKIQNILETNGYSKEDMFHLPYSYINRILGGKGE